MAFTINNYVGFETQGAEEASATSGTPTYPTTGQRSGDAYLHLPTNATWTVPWVTDGVTDAGNKHIFGFGFKLTTTANRKIATVKDDSAGIILEIFVLSTGELQLRNANTGVVDNSAASIYDDGNWHYVAVYADLNSASADWEWWIDGTSENSGTGVDFTDGNAFGSSSSVILLAGTGETNGADFDDLYIASGATATSEVFTDFEVFGYQNIKASATPDAGLEGNSATTGDDANWSVLGETPGTDDATFSYDGAAEYGTVDLASFGAEIDGDSSIKAIKGIWRLEYSGGGSAAHAVGLGDSGDGDSAAVTNVTLTTTPTEYFVLRTTDLPTSSQDIRQGFSNEGGRNLDAYEMWAMIAHVPGPPSFDDALTIAAAATMTAATAATAEGSAALAAAGTISTAANVTAEAAAAMAADATVISAQLLVQNESVALSADAILAAVLDAIMDGGVALSGAAAFAAIADATADGQIGITADAALAVIAAALVDESVAIAADATLALAGGLLVEESAAVVADATLGAQTDAAAEAAVDIAADAAAAASADVTAETAAALVADAPVSNSADVTVEASLSIDADGVLSAAGQADAEAALTIAADAVMASAKMLNQQEAATLAADAALATQVLSTSEGVVTLAADGTVSVVSTVDEDTGTVANMTRPITTCITAPVTADLFETPWQDQCA